MSNIIEVQIIRTVISAEIKSLFAPGGGNGDMMRSVYDSDADGVVNDSERLAGQLASHYASLSSLLAHTADSNNPHNVTASQLGLGNVDNTSDINKPVSTAQQAALDLKVDKVTGKALSTEDYTTTEKSKLAGIASGATANQTDAYLLSRANHTGTQAATTITEDSTHRFATDAEKTSWNSKQAGDATLTALAALATGADQLPYSTGTDTFSQTPLTAFARTLLDDADAATARGTLGIEEVNDVPFTGSISWTATTAPSGTHNNRISYSKFARGVHFLIIINYPIAGSAVTAATLTGVFQADGGQLPNPQVPDGFNSASAIFQRFFASFSTSITATPVGTGGYFRRNSVNSANEIIAGSATSGAYRIVSIQGSYLT